MSVASISISESRRKSKVKNAMKKEKVIEKEPSEIPTTGHELLEWTKNHMSFISVDTQKISSDEEEEIALQTFTDIADKPPVDVQPEAALKPAGKKGKKGKKEKKKKKKKKKKDAVYKLPRPPGMHDSVVSLIKLRQAIKQQELLLKELEGKKGAKKKGGKKKKKKKKKEEAQQKPEAKKKPKIMSAAQAKAEKAAEEAARRKLEEEERLKVELEDKAKELEQNYRLEGFKKTLQMIDSSIDYIKELGLVEMKDIYWRLYVKCGKLPIVDHIPDVSVYLHIWREAMEGTTPKDAAEKTEDALKLIEVLEDFIDSKPVDSQRTLENFKWLRLSMREQLAQTMDAMTYKIVKDIHNNMTHLSLTNREFNYTDERFILCLWLIFKRPPSLFNPRKPEPPPIALYLEPLQMHLEFPANINGEGIFFRVLYVTYDHYSDVCKNVVGPTKPEYYNCNVVDVAIKDWKVKKKYKVLGRYRTLYENEILKQEQMMVENPLCRPDANPANRQDLPPLPPFELPVVDIDGEIPEVPGMILNPTPEEYAEVTDEREFYAMKEQLRITVPENEINLRQYTILGGMFNVQLFRQPPQPSYLVSVELNIAAFLLPKELEEVEFYAEYVPLPPSDEQRTPEELEAALRQQEEGFARLVSVTITLPKRVIYLEPPVICRWDNNQKLWIKDDIHDVKPNEEKGTISFRTGRLGIFGLAALRYGNLPYQTWEMKPDGDGGIVLQITGSVLLIEFKIKATRITITQFQNGPENIFNQFVGKPYRLRKLKKILREIGVDFFPEYDAFPYIEGTCEKQWATEHMCYWNMAQLSLGYNLAWSRWNASEGFRSIVMQMRLYNPEAHSQKSYNLAHVTPLRAAFINCTEVTPTFCPDPVEGSKFAANLWFLMTTTGGVYVRSRLLEAPQDTVYTVAQMLIGTRILSMG